MNNDILTLLKTTYENDSSCILIIDAMRQLIWQNKKHTPFESYSDTPAEILRLPKSGSIPSGDYSYSANGIIYDYHLTNVSDEYYIISCSNIPAICKYLENKYTRENIENELAMTKSESMSISAAAAQLNDYFENFEDDYISPERLNEQTNIIMHCCARILKKQYLLEEVLRYYKEDELADDILNCSEIIKSFSENCKNVIGPRGKTKIIFEESDDIYIKASWKRMEYFLLCALLTLRKKYSGIYKLKISYSQIVDEVVINMKLIHTDEELPERPPLLSEFTPIYKDIPTYEIEQIIIRKFLERYNGFIIDSTESKNKFISLRFPAVDADSELKLASPRKSILGGNIITPYHAILFEISDFRYY